MTEKGDIGYYPRDVVMTARQMGVTPDKVVALKIKSSIERGNPLVTPGDPFVVMGVDAWEGNFYPAGSFQTVEDAREYAIRRQDMEKLFDDGSEDFFSVYTSEGVAIPLTKPNAD